MIFTLITPKNSKLELDTEKVEEVVIELDDEKYLIKIIKL